MSILCPAIDFLGKGTHHYGKWHNASETGRGLPGQNWHYITETGGTVTSEIAD